MEKSLEATGKSIDAAIQAALDEVGMERDQVSVEVLEKPKTGFLGLGSSLARVRISYSVSRADKAEAFLSGLLTRMGSSAQPVVTERSDGALSVEFVGSGLGLLIGHRGDTLDAIQHLTNYVVNRGEETPIRVDIDAENYRAKRVESLKRLAQKTGEKVLKSRKNMTLESMNAYERHIIHAALQEMPGLSTYSVGMDPNRRVVVSCGRPTEGRPPAGRGKPRQGGMAQRTGGDKGHGDRPPYQRAPGGARGGARPPRQSGGGARVPRETQAPPKPSITPGPGSPRPYDRIRGTEE